MLVSSNRYGENIAYAYAMILRGYLHLVHIHENGVFGSGVIKGHLHCAPTSNLHSFKMRGPVIWKEALKYAKVILAEENGFYFENVMTKWVFGKN